MNQQIDQFFTAYPEEISQWQRNINRLPLKHKFLMQAEGLGVALNITEFMLFNDGYVHLEASLVLPNSWVNKYEFVSFYYDNDEMGVWVMLQTMLEKALDHAKKVGA